jgi:hypothetical protein
MGRLNADEHRSQSRDTKRPHASGGVRDLVIKSRDHGERQVYERIVELHMEIAETLEALLDR